MPYIGRRSAPFSIGSTSNTYVQAQGYLTTEVGDVSNTYLQMQGYGVGDVSNTYLQVQGYGVGDVSNTYLQTQLASSGYQAGEVIETFANLCDGSSVTVSSGTYTTTNVTAVQSMTTSYADVNGSAITYTPPSDASRVIYEFSCQVGSTGAHDIGHFKFYIDGVEATDARVATGGHSTVEYGRMSFKWIVSIGSANAATGAQATWTTGKEMKLQARAYHAIHDPKLHGTYYWDGAVSEQFSRPLLTITAIK